MTLNQAKPLVNPTLQVITSRKDKNMPKSKQEKSKQEVKGWEEIHKMFDELVEYQDNYELRDKLSTICWRIIGKFKHLLEADRKAIREEIRGMKQYHEWASKRDNQIHDVVQKKINEIIDYLTTLSTKNKQLPL